MPKLNWKIIKSNISEALEELKSVEKRIDSGKFPNEGELQVVFEHLYHHINFAWNARKISTKRYKDLSDKDFGLLGKFPTDIEEWSISDSVNKTSNKR